MVQNQNFGPLTLGTQRPPLGAILEVGHPFVRTATRNHVNCWLFNEGAGTKVNDICGGKHGSFNATSAATFPKWGGTPHGTGVDFGWTSSSNIPRLEIPNTSIGTAFTVAFAFFWNGGSTSLQCLFAINNGVGFYLKGASGAIQYFNGGTSTLVCKSKAWNHVVYTQSASGTGVWQINGVISDTGVTGGGTFIANRIGGDTTSEVLQGVMESVMVWDNVFTQQEMKQLYQAPYGHLYIPIFRRSESVQSSISAAITNTAGLITNSVGSTESQSATATSTAGQSSNSIAATESLTVTVTSTSGQVTTAISTTEIESETITSTAGLVSNAITTAQSITATITSQSGLASSSIASASSAVIPFTGGGAFRKKKRKRDAVIEGRGATVFTRPGIGTLIGAVNGAAIGVGSGLRLSAGRGSAKGVSIGLVYGRGATISTASRKGRTLAIQNPSAEELAFLLQEMC